jgi:hypothetical protein
MRSQLILSLVLLILGLSHLALSLPQPKGSLPPSSSLNTTTSDSTILLSARSDGSSGTSLGTGGIIGIVVGSVVLLGIVAWFMALLKKK